MSNINMKNDDDEMKEEYDFSQAQRGPFLPAKPNKERITIRLDADILQWFRETVHRQGGGNYQSLINDALRQHIGAQQYAWEETVRRIVREELGRYDAGRNQAGA